MSTAFSLKSVSFFSGSRASVGRSSRGLCASRRSLSVDSSRRAEIDRVKLYYYHAETPMADTVLRYELMGRIQPYSMFLQRPERELIKRGDQDGRKVVFF